MKPLRTLHRWLGLLIFIQVLIWVGSGFIISLLDAETAAGGTLRLPPPEPVPLAGAALLPISDLPIERAGLETVGLIRVDGTAVYRLVSDQGVRLIHAQSGQPFTVDPAMAERIARRSYSGDGGTLGVIRLENPGELVNFEGAAWQVAFDDALGTRAYVDARDGRLLAHRNDRSALLEWLLRLHFMDYDGGHDFNHPLIVGAAFATLWLAVSGILLLISSLRRVGLR